MTENIYRNFEITTLGAVMLLREAMSMIADRLKPEHFADPRHKIIFSACLAQYREGKPMDVVSINYVLKKEGKLDSAGGSFYLMELSNSCIGVANLKYHAFKITEAYVMRELDKLFDSGKINLRSLKNPLEVSGEVVNKLINITSEIVPIENIHSWDYVIKLLIELREMANSHYEGRVMGVDTRFPSINKITEGFHPGELIVVAGRPAMGKTTMALSMAVDMSYLYPVVFFSLEMTGENLMKKVLSKESSVDYNNIRGARLTPDEWERIHEARERMKKMRLIIDESPSHTVTSIRASLMRLKGQFPNMSSVFIDQLNFIKPEGTFSTKDQEVGNVTRALKTLARELNVPIILLSQLNRAVEQNPGKLPALSNLRDSGNIEQDADMVAFMYRPQYYGIESYSDGSSTIDTAEFIIAKQRNGITGNARLIFEGRFSRFRDYIDPPSIDDKKSDDDEDLPF